MRQIVTGFHSFTSGENRETFLWGTHLRRIVAQYSLSGCKTQEFDRWRPSVTLNARFFVFMTRRRDDLLQAGYGWKLTTGQGFETIVLCGQCPACGREGVVCGSALQVSCLTYRAAQENPHPQRSLPPCGICGITLLKIQAELVAGAYIEIALKPNLKSKFAGLTEGDFPRYFQRQFQGSRVGASRNEDCVGCFAVYFDDWRNAVGVRLGSAHRDRTGDFCQCKLSEWYLHQGQEPA